MRHSNNNNGSNSRRRSALVVAALSVAAASRSQPWHHLRQPAAAVGARTAVVAVVAIAVRGSNDGDDDDNDDEHAGCLTEGPAAPPVHQAGVTACNDKNQRLTKSMGSETRVTKPIVGRETRVTKSTMASGIRATKPIPVPASELQAAMPVGSNTTSISTTSTTTSTITTTSSSSRSRCGARLLAARVARGGCTEYRRRLLPGRARRRRPLRRFLAPALVWAFAAVVDYDLWWKLGPTAVSPASNGDTSTRPFGSVIGHLAEVIAVNRAHFVCFHILLVLALLSHMAVTFADPGFCPPREASFLAEEKAQESGRWCGHCHAFKPPRAHHCRRCGGCVARMDHHCIYAANCVGTGNHKQFVLLLLYSASCAAHANLLYFRVLGRGLVNSSAKNALSGVGGASAAATAATAAQCSASAWQGVSTTSSSLSSSSLIGGGGGIEPRGWRGVVSVARRLFLPVLAVVVLSWLVALLSVHLYGVAVDAGTVDRMQAASAGRSAEEAAVAAAATGSAGLGSGAGHGRRFLLYRGQAVPSPSDLRTPSGGLFDFLKGEQGAGAALRSSTGNSNSDSKSSRNSKTSGAGARAAAPSAAGELAPFVAISLALGREEGIHGVADYPRGPLGRVGATAAAAAAGTVVDSNGEECRGMRGEAAALSSVFCGRWRTLREEVLGEGPWVMWFVPSPAKLAPEVRERVFAPALSQEGTRVFCGPAR